MCTTLIDTGDPVAALRAGVDAVASMDVAALPATGALDLARELATGIARLTGVRLACLQAVADSGAWALDGSKSMPWALARREDAGIASVRAEVTLAQRLEVELPLTAAALRAGDLSLGQGEAAGPVGADQQRPPGRAEGPGVG